MAYEERGGDAAPSEDDERVTVIRERWKRARDGLADWRKDAREDFAYAAGHQWDPKDIAKLENEGRPAVTFNRIGAVIDAIAGLEVNNRQAVKYYPREQGDIGVDQVVTAAAVWVRDNCYGEDEESEAFRDASICGVGATETRMDYEEEPDGLIRIDRRDPLSVLWDPAAQKKSNRDARYVFHASWIDKEEARKRWPKSADASALLDDDLEQGSGTQPHDADRAFMYEGKEGDDDETRKDQVLVLHYQCYELEPSYRLHDPFTNTVKTFSQEEFTRLEGNVEQLGMKLVGASKNAQPNEIQYVKQQRRVYYRAFLIGETLLEYGLAPCQHGFTIRFITCKRDRNFNQWYGVVRPMKDPQKWGNKFFSQILDILARNTKGGAFVEEGALIDKTKAEDQWAQPSPLILLREGAVAQGKIKERAAAGYPSGIDRLMQFAFEAMPYVSGIPLEAMGLTGSDQAGAVEEQRKKAAMAILAPLFDSLRCYRKEQGRVLLYFIQEYLTDGRLIRIVGKDGGTNFVPLVKQEGLAEYDLVVDEAPTSPDFREKTWNAVNQVLPIMLKQGYPIPPTVFKYAPLPTDVSQEMAKYAQGYIPPAMQQQMQQMQEQLQQMGKQHQQTAQQLTQLQLDRQVEAAEVQRKDVDSQRRAAVKLQQIEAEKENTRVQADAQRTRDTRDALATVSGLEVQHADAQTRQKDAATRSADAVTRREDAKTRRIVANKPAPAPSRPQ